MEKEQIIHVLCLFISSSLNSFYFISHIPNKLKADYFFAHDQLLQQLHHLKLSIFIPFVLLSMHFKNYLEPVSVLCIEIYSKFRRNVR